MVKRVRGSATGRPIMALLDLLGRRWAMGILWTLCRDGTGTFRELQARCGGISPTVLNTRLKELQAAGLVVKLGNRYAVSKLGREVYAALLPLSATSKKWASLLARQTAGTNA